MALTLDCDDCDDAWDTVDTDDGEVCVDDAGEVVAVEAMDEGCILSFAVNLPMLS